MRHIVNGGPEVAHSWQIAVTRVNFITQFVVGRAAYGVFGSSIGITDVQVFDCFFVEGGIG